MGSLLYVDTSMCVLYKRCKFIRGCENVIACKVCSSEEEDWRHVRYVHCLLASGTHEFLTVAHLQYNQYTYVVQNYQVPLNLMRDQAMSRCVRSFNLNTNTQIKYSKIAEYSRVRQEYICTYVLHQNIQSTCMRYLAPIIRAYEMITKQDSNAMQ